MTGRRTTSSTRTTQDGTSTMDALVQRAYGSAEMLRIEQIDKPVIGDDEVLVRVRAAGVNHADWVMTSGTPLIARLAFGLRVPKIRVRGQDVAGVVEAVGAKVTGLGVGDEVYGELAGGCFAEFVSAPANRLALKPANLTFEQAAAVPLAANTALQGIGDAGQLKPGQSVLINGASGGVGTCAVQVAKALGAEVTAVCSARNAQLVRTLGADHVVDYASDDFTAGTERYDLIFDLIGNHPIRRCVKALNPKGTLVLSSGTGSRILGPLGRMLRALAISPFVGQRLVVGWTPKQGMLPQLTELIERGQLTPAIDRVFPLAESADAIDYFVNQHASGKIVVTMEKGRHK